MFAEYHDYAAKQESPVPQLPLPHLLQHLLQHLLHRAARLLGTLRARHEPRAPRALPAPPALLSSRSGSRP